MRNGRKTHKLVAEDSIPDDHHFMRCCRYQAMCLGLIRDFQAATETDGSSLCANGQKNSVHTSHSALDGAARSHNVRFHTPPGPNLAQDEELATAAAFWGLEVGWGMLGVWEVRVAEEVDDACLYRRNYNCGRIMHAL